MEIKLTIVLFILFIHWIADFLLQTDKQAQGKSKNWSDLLDHTATYSLFWGVLILPIIMFNHFLSWNTLGWQLKMIYFVPITFICHTITDYFTSRLNSKLWEEKKVHWFFVSLGVDQMAHYIQLLLTYYFLTK